MLVSLMGSAVALSPVASAGSSDSGGCSGGFLTFPAWYRGLTKGGCNLKSPTDLGGDPKTQLNRYIFKIAFNILEIAFQVVAYITVGYIIYGGFKYLTSASDPGKIAGGRKTIQNALIGLILSFVAIAIVNLITNSIK